MAKTFCLAAIIFFLLSSCSKDDANSTDDQTVGTQSNSSSGSSGSTPFKSLFRDSLQKESLFNSCTEDVITIAGGNIIIDVHGTFNENNSTIFIHTSLEGVTATGKAGTLYSLTGSFDEQASEYNNGVFTTRLQHFDRLIEPGSHRHAMVRSAYYIQVDAAGQVTIMKEPGRGIYCIK